MPRLVNRRPGFLLASVLLVLLPRPAGSDIAPNPLSGGWPITPFEEETTTVRMVAEDVVVRIYADSVVTVASFSMRNEGKTVDMAVGFPFRYAHDVVRFEAFVNSQSVAVRDVQKAGSDPERRKTWTVYWKLWDVHFYEGKACEIRVEYATRPMKGGLGLRNQVGASLPPDELKALQDAMTVHEVEYILETGKPWNSVLDRCKVSFELAGITADHIVRFQPDEGIAATNGVVWEYIDYEPSSWISLTYTPNHSVQEVLQILRSTVAQFPDNAPLASDVGRFCGSILGKSEIEREIYHSFLAHWDKPVPQLIEYGPGGRCRVNYSGEGNFYTAWQMANILFKRYEQAGELDKGRDIAQTVSKMSAAIVDSLQICDLPESDRLSRDAKALRDLCDELIKTKP